MKDITPSEKFHAIKISQALQDHFDQNPGVTVMYSTDAYEVLVTKGLVERDRHHGIKFREFLKKLRYANALSFIPQCTAQLGSGSITNWIFRSNREATIRSKNLTIEGISKRIQIDDSVLKEAEQIIASLPKRKESDLDFTALDTRRNYPRAYEYWTSKEVDLRMKISNEITDPIELSRIFKRQPSAIENKRKDI